MSSIDKAVQVIRMHDADGMCNEPECLAQDLADAGLLAPDLPEPDLDTSDPAHCAEYLEWWDGPVPTVWNKSLPGGFTVQVFPDRPEVQMCEWWEPMEPFSHAEALHLAYALLAAVQWAEKEHKA